MGGEEGNGKEGRCELCPVAKIPAGAHFSSSYDEDCLSRHLFEVMECYSIYIYMECKGDISVDSHATQNLYHR